MAEQRTFAGLAWSTKGRTTRRERFLGEMNAVIPWERLTGLIEPYYPKAGRGRQPVGLERMLRIYFLQQWFDLSDPAAEDAIYDSESMRRFAGVELGEDRIPDETTILRFRHLLEEHGPTERIFEEIGALLEERGLVLKSGTIVDATIIAAPSSTKNREGKRDPEMKQTKKGNTWHFGMKVHVGTDALLQGDEEEVYGDRAYWSEGHRKTFREAGIRYRMNRRATSKRPLSPGWKELNRKRSRVRARGEHAFHVAKRLWGFNKVRYRGLAKNQARAFAVFALVNLYLVRSQLRPPGATCAL